MGSLEQNENTALYFAVDKNYIEIVKLLLTNKKIDLNILNKINYGLDNKCKFDHWEWIQKQEITVLYRAIERIYLEQIKLLLTNENLDLNVLNKTWKKSIVNDDWKEQDEEEEEEEEEDKKEEEDETILNTVLHLAVKNQNIPVIKLLMKHKSFDINVTDSIGKKPIDYATNDKIKEILN